MEYILAATEKGYEQMPVRDGRASYRGEEYRIKDFQAGCWGETAEGREILYLPDGKRCFEHRGNITLAEKGADINIPDIGYAISIEKGKLEASGLTGDSRLYLNRRRLAGEASALVGRSEYKLPEIRGRALVKTVNVNIMQVYAMAEFADDMEYNKKIRELTGKITLKYPGRRAPRIPVLPEQFVYGMLPDYGEGKEPFDLAVGLEVESVTKAGFTRMQSPFVIIGEAGKGKTNMVKALLNQISGSGRAYVFDSSAMGLYSYRDKEGVSYVQDEDGFEDFVEQMKELTEGRRRRCREALGGDGAMTPEMYYRSEEPVYIVIDDMDQFLADGEAFGEELGRVLPDAAECGVGVIATVHAAKLKGLDPLSKWVKKAAHGLVLSPQGTLNIFPVRVQREYPQMGRGLLFHNGAYVTVLLPGCE